MNKNKEQELNRINYICPKWTKKGFGSLLLDSCQICAGHRFFFGRPMGPRVGRVAPLRSHKLGGVNTQHPSFKKNVTWNCTTSYWWNVTSSKSLLPKEFSSDCAWKKLKVWAVEEQVCLHLILRNATSPADLFHVRTWATLTHPAR